MLWETDGRGCEELNRKRYLFSVSSHIYNTHLGPATMWRETALAMNFLEDKVNFLEIDQVTLKLMEFLG